MDYPHTHRDEELIEELHGHLIADPDRWLEDPDNPETAAWVEAQTTRRGALRKCCRSRLSAAVGS